MQKFVTRFKMLVAHEKESNDWTVTAMDSETAEMKWVTDCQKQQTGSQIRIVENPARFVL